MKRAWSVQALIRRLRGFSGDESGQSLLVMALTIFGLVISTMLIVGVGGVTSQRIRLQHAADAAAYAGAMIQADCLSQIAWCNDAMAAVYYKLVRLAVDNIVMSVEAEMANPDPWWDPDGIEGLPSVGDVLDEVAPDRAEVVRRADETRDLAAEWIENGEVWLRRLSRVQRAVAIMAPSLIEHQVWHTAQANYYTDNERDGKHDKALRVALWPHMQFYPGAAQKWDLNIFKTGEPEVYPNGWELSSNTHPDFLMRATHESKRDIPFSGEENRYALSVIRGTQETTIDPLVIQSWEDHPGNWTQYLSFTDEHGDSHEVITIGDGSMFLNGQLVKALEHGSEVDGRRFEVIDGIMYLDGKPVTEDTTVEVNGVEVPLVLSPWIGNFNVVTLTWVIDGIAITCHPGGIRFRYSTPAGWVNVQDDDQARINGLTTANADGRWTRYGHYDSEWQWANRHRHDRHLHRMRTIVDGEQFLYERVVVGTLLKDMSWMRLATHDLHRSGDWCPERGEPDPYWRLPDQGEYPEAEFDWTALSDSADFDEFGSEADTAWAHYPLWARPVRDPHDPGRDDPRLEDRDFGGFFSLASGRHRGGYSYSQTRPASYVQNVHDSGNPYLDRSELVTTVSPKYYVEFITTLIPDGSGGLKRVPLIRGDGTPRVVEEDEEGNFLVNSYTRIVYHPDDVSEDWIDTAYPLRRIGEGMLVEGAPGFWIERFDQVEGHDYDEMNEYELLIAREDRLLAAFRRAHPEVPEIGRPFITFQDPRDGKYKLQVFCPLGSVPKFRRAPRYYTNRYGGNSVPVSAHGTWSAGGVQEYREALETYPAYYRRYIRDAAGTISGRDYFTINLSGISSPLQATSEVFRRGIVVGVHAPESISWLAKLFGGADTIRRDRRAKTDDLRRRLDQDQSTDPLRFIGVVNPLRVTAEPGTDPHKWTSGSFAFAAARVFVRSPDGRMITNFDPANAGLGTDLIGRMVSESRQKWLGSDRNLFEPTWTAALVPIRNAVRLEDVYWPDEIEERDDNAVAFLMRQFFGQRGGRDRNWWRLSLAESGDGQRTSDRRVRRSVEAITAPPMQGDRAGHRLFTNYESLDLDDLIRH